MGGFPCVMYLPCIWLSAHGEVSGRRVPDTWHTAKRRAHGEFTFSGSGVHCFVASTEYLPSLLDFVSGNPSLLAN